MTKGEDFYWGVLYFLNLRDYYYFNFLIYFGTFSVHHYSFTICIYSFIHLYIYTRGRNMYTLACISEFVRKLKMATILQKRKCSTPAWKVSKILTCYDVCPCSWYWYWNYTGPLNST